jgi:site-specific recombinase XerC
MADATAAVSPLRRRMIDDMSLRNLSPATQRSYLHAVTKFFSRYFGRSPDKLGLEDVRAFQVYLVSQGISWPALNQTVCALRFFYGVTLDRAEIPERIVYARTPRKLPAILSADEVVRFLEAVPSLKARTALTTAYAAGLRALRRHPAHHRDICARTFAVRHFMSIGSRPNIEPRGVATATNATTTYVRNLIGPLVGHTGEPRMPMAPPVTATNTTNSTSPTLIRGCSVAPNQSPGAGVAAQIP